MTGAGPAVTDGPLAPLPATVSTVAYLGTPDIAVAPLVGLVEAGVDVAVVITGPDRRRGRGSATSPTPVSQAARDLGLPVAHDLAALDRVGIDLAVVVAFGTIIPVAVLQRIPMVNLHFSLLPRWRGAAPVERAILAGDRATGVCLMQVEAGLDTGGILGCTTVDLDDHVTAAGLSATLSSLGRDLLVDAVTGPLPTAVPQHGDATYAAKLTTADVALDWGLGAEALARRVRVGGAWTQFRGARLVVTAAVARVAGPGDPPPGVLDGTRVGTASGCLELIEVKPAGRRAQAAADWVRGARPHAGERLGPADG